MISSGKTFHNYGYKEDNSGGGNNASLRITQVKKRRYQEKGKGSKAKLSRKLENM